MAVNAYFGATTAWFSEFDTAPSRILAHHWPDTPNHGDITRIDWATVEPIDILTGGYPCQPFSAAGRRKGVDDDRHLWPYVVEAISELQPEVCVFENVQGHLTLGFDEVIRDLTILGYSTQWTVVTAAEVGACHKRARLFILATKGNTDGPLRGRADRRGRLYRDSGVRRFIPSPTESVDGGQGITSDAADAHKVRRADVSGSTGKGERSGETHLGYDGSRSERRGPSVTTGVPGEMRCGRRGTGLSANGGRSAEVAQWPSKVVGRDEAEGRAVQSPDSRGEQAGTGPEATRHDADRDLSGRGVVGAERRSIRTGPVRGEVAENGDDEIGSDIPDVGACHKRERVFIVATPSDAECRGWDGWSRNAVGKPIERTATAGDREGCDRGHPVTLLPTPNASDGSGGGQHPDRRVGHSRQIIDHALALTESWGDYAPAIHWAEHAVGRPAPAPTELGRYGNPQLSPRFVEWMMLLPAGHVTDPAIGLTRAEQLRALGNGVVPAQAYAALQILVPMAVAA